MEGVVWAALITALSALAVAVGGWYVNRSHGLPSGTAVAIRAELDELVESQKGKITRLTADLDEEKAGRQNDKVECLRKIASLGDALLERDIIIQSLYRRLGLDPPVLSDPHA